LGAGELMVYSIDRDGVGDGFDLELTQRIATAVSVPVIAGGGAGRITDVYDAFTCGKAEAVALASILHYNFVRNMRDLDGDYTAEGNIEFLKRGKIPAKIQDASLEDIKAYLSEHGVACRRPSKQAGRLSCGEKEN